METIRDLMIELDGADRDTVNRIAFEKGSLAVRLAMLGIASIKRGDSPLWWGYPPGVFVAYKWDGAPMRDLVSELAEYIRALGYRAFLDVEKLTADADAYFEIPQYISSLGDCHFYVLLLTERSADLIDARNNKTSWVHDEYQHALRLAAAGRLIVVPVLLETNGLVDGLTMDHVIDLRENTRDFAKLENILTPAPAALDREATLELAMTVARFDRSFLGQHWAESATLLAATPHLAHTFDHQFRRMLHAIYTANVDGMKATFAQLTGVYGMPIVMRIYKGYCAKHGIPVRLS